MKDLNPCLSFQITYGGEKKRSFCFCMSIIYLSTPCVAFQLCLSVRMTLYLKRHLHLTLSSVPLNVTRKFMYLRRRLMGNLK